ncbi:YfhO family protein [Secundilactobacillus muriivasis]
MRVLKPEVNEATLRRTRFKSRVGDLAPALSFSRIGVKMGVASILTLAVLGLVFSYYHVTPFGSRNLLIGDMSAQYLQFLTYFRHVITTGQFATYSFSFGVGENLVPMVAYYLLSPFNLLVGLFSVGQLPMAITLILMLKISASAAAMSYYLARHTHQMRWGIVAFAVAYALCGFVTADFVNIMWLDGLIYLPLIAASIDRVRDGQRSLGLFVWLTLTILSNYYVGYMTGLFTVIYFGYVFLTRPNPTVATGRMLLTFLVTEACSVLTSMIVLIPTGLGMLLTSKLSTNTNEFAIQPMYGPEILSQLGIGGENYTNRLIHAPALYATLVVALLVMSYFVNAKITRRQKLGATAVFGILLISMFVQPLNTAWHMFHQPAGSPFRYAFLVSFMAVMIAYEAWLAQPQQLKRWQKLAIPASLMGLLVAGFGYLRLAKHSPALAVLTHSYYQLQPNSAKLLLLNLLVIGVDAAIIFTTFRRHQIMTLALTAAVMGEVSLNFADTLRSAPLASQRGYQTDVAQQAKLITPQTSQRQLYRVNYAGPSLGRTYPKSSYVGYNDAQIYNFNGIKQYDSTMNEQTREALMALGLYSKNARRISNQGVTAISELLLGVKTSVNSQTGVKSNPYYLGMGFPVNSQFVQFKPQRFAIFTNLETILQRIQPTSGRYLQPATVTATHQAAALTASGRHRYQLQVTTQTSGPLYLEAADKRISTATITVNGHAIKSMVTKNNHDLIRLGDYAKGAHVVIGISAPTQASTHKIHLLSLDAAKLQALTQTRQQQAFKPTISGNRVSGTVTKTSATNHWLYTAIPYDKGWSATVNGKAVQTRQVLGNFTAVPLTQKTNHVTLQYHVPGLALGAGLSVIGLLSFGGYDWLRRRRQQRTDEVA